MLRALVVHPATFHCKVARKALANGREQAAGHLFGAIASEYLKPGMLDDVRLKTIADWIADKYDPDRRFVDRLVGECRAAALRYSAATRDAIAESRDELVRLEAASSTVVKETPTQRAERRQKVLDPILANKHWTVNQWADEVNLPNSTTFRYYNGQTNPRPDTRDALATPLGIKSEDLPS